MSNNHGHLPINQICRQSRQSITTTVRPSILDCNIPAFVEASVIKPLTKGSDEVCGVSGRCNPQKPHYRRLRLLRGRIGRLPCNGRSTAKRNELAPLHSITSSARASSAG